MPIKQIISNKKAYLPLLLLADEQESMIDCYLERGEMYILFDGTTAKAECDVKDEGDKILEIKNIAVAPEFQKTGCGKMMIDFITEKYRDKFSFLRAGTGDSPLTVPFYEKCGFIYSLRV